MIEQESGGNAEKWPDIMQCSESMGLSPNSITDPIASIKQGIKVFSELVKQGKDAGVDDNTVLQSYNFGGGYIGYIRDNHGGVHSEAAARAFSALMKQKYGYSSYGDVLYVQHVTSKMQYGSGNGIENYDTLYAELMSYRDTPYLYGGNSYSGIDCAALVQNCYRIIGKNLPRTAQAQYDMSRHI